MKVIVPTVLTRVWAEKLAPSLDVHSICIEQAGIYILKKSETFPKPIFKMEKLCQS